MVNNMMYLDNLDVNNKKVFVRVDYNVPIKDGEVTDNNRIKASLNTIRYLIDNNAKVVLFSHLGKVKSQEDALKNDMKYVVPELSRLLNMNVKFSNTLVGEEFENNLNSLNSKEVLLVQNTRVLDLDNNKESGCDEELSKYWASLCDIYVMDAFGSAHRAHASTYGIAKYAMISAIGPLMKKEMSLLDDIIRKNDKILILGGAKAEDKIKMINKLAPTSECVLIGGSMSAPFLKARGFNTGACVFSDEALKEATNLLIKYRNKIILPIDFVTSKNIDGETTIKDVEFFESDDLQFDIGPKTIDLFKTMLFKSTNILWNGPVGLFENDKYSDGTYKLLDFLSDFNAKVVICGGDTGSAVKKYNMEDLFVISTGGGASLEYLGGIKFPIIELLENK